MINQEKLATAFHDRMTEGQSFEKTGQYRQDFFKLVVERANFVRFSVIAAASRG
jgi:hypothetical protein